MINKFIRGQLWMIRTYINKDDRVFSGEHIALILGVNKENTLTIIPSTSKLNPENKILTSVELELTNFDGATTIGHFIPNMIQTIDTRKALRYIGMLDKRSVMEVQKAVGEYLGLGLMKFEQSFDNDKKSENKQPVAKEEKQKPIAKKEEKKPIKATSNLEKTSKTRPKIGDIKYVRGKEVKMIMDCKKEYGIISKWPKHILDSIVEDYKNGNSESVLAFKYGTSDSTISRILIKRNLT